MKGYKCDRCGKFVPGSDLPLPLVKITISDYIGHGAVEERDESIDLCSECEDALKIWLTINVFLKKVEEGRPT